MPHLVGEDRIRIQITLPPTVELALRNRFGAGGWIGIEPVIVDQRIDIEIHLGVWRIAVGIDSGTNLGSHALLENEEVAVIAHKHRRHARRGCSRNFVIDKRQLDLDAHRRGG